MKSKHFILDPDHGLVINLTDSRLFSGLNNTIWLNKDHYQKTIDEYLTKYPNYRANDLDFSIDIEKYLKEIAKVYCKYFNKQLGGKWKLYSLYSPPYYDFVTDEIVLHCAEPDDTILDNITTEKAYIFGGAEIYAKYFDKCDELFITEVDTIVNADAKFPDFDINNWELIDKQTFKKDKNNEYDYSFLHFKRK